MNAKKYEKSTFIKCVVIILIIFELLGIGYLSQVKINTYRSLTIVGIEKKQAMVICDKETRSRLYKNTYIYYKDKKYKYELQEEEQKGEKPNTYYEISMRFQKNMEEGELKELSINTAHLIDKKINMIDVIRNMWGGDKNR